MAIEVSVETLIEAPRRKVRFMGKNFSYEYRVIASRGDRFVEMEVDEPFPMHIRYELDDRGGATARAHPHEWRARRIFPDRWSADARDGASQYR